MRNSIPDLQARLDALRSEIDELDALESPTEEQTLRFGVALDEFESTKVEIDGEQARQARIDAVRATANETTTVREGGFHAPNVVVKRSPFDGIEGIRSGFVSSDDLRARAFTAIEETTDVEAGYQERATQLVKQSGAMGMHILLTGSPEYRSAFGKYLRNPNLFGSMLTKEEARAFFEADAYEKSRAAMSTTAANGGYLIPWLQDSSIVLTSNGSSNPFRQISRIETGVSNTWNGITSAGVTAEWKGEGSAAADATPTFGRPGITAVTGMAYVLGSYEAFADTDIESQLPMLIQDAKDNLEATAFATGAGSTTAPKGIVTAVAAVTASRVSPTTGGGFSAATEVYKVINAVPPRHRSKASWVANYTVLNSIRAFDVYGGSSFWADLSADTPPNLLGRPVYESSAMSSTVTTGSNHLLAGDFSQYVIYDRAGVTLEYIQNVADTSTGRPTGQRGFAAWWRTGADVVNVNGFRLLQL